MIYSLIPRFQALLTERDRKEKYYRQIENIKKEKKIIVDVSFGGIGDSLIWSTLPQLLKETFNVDFYLSENNKSVFRNPDTLKLCFENNPFFRGFEQNEKYFKLDIFESEKSIANFISDKGGLNAIERLEKQFDLNGTGLPRLYYKPRKLDDFTNVILVDKNMISGKKFGWLYKKDAFEKEANKYLDLTSRIEYVDTSKQDLFKYVDMIYSCKRFIGTFSGGSAIAACFDKPFSVIWPYNAIDGSNYQFRFAKSRGDYVK